METSLNMQKYYNYREQMGRLKKALRDGFLLEAVFIEYAVMEDRTEAILRYEGNSIKPKDPKSFISIEKKLNKIKTIAREKKSLANRYFGDELADDILKWKNERNSLIHAMIKRKLSTEDIEAVAFKGEELVNKLNKRSQNYKRAVERKNAKLKKE